MNVLKLDKDDIQHTNLPPFSVTVNESLTTALYIDSNLQLDLIHALQRNKVESILDFKDGLYERLTVQDNLKFFHKWFRCSTPLSEILVMFELHHCTKKTLKKCSVSETRRVHYAKYFLSKSSLMVFQEPVHGVDVSTINTFLNMLQRLIEYRTPVLILAANLEHALLLGDVVYKLQEKGLEEIEIDPEDNKTDTESTSVPATINLFKIPAKVEDKVILFDPTEIDYIESQEGKSMLVINNESFINDSTLVELENKLAVYGFYRCHRSYIVNLQKVREIITWSKNTYSLRIDNKNQSTIPLSRTKIQEIHERFNIK